MKDEQVLQLLTTPLREYGALTGNLEREVCALPGARTSQATISSSQTRKKIPQGIPGGKGWAQVLGEPWRTFFYGAHYDSYKNVQGTSILTA